jgi:hypothetical protein
MVRRLFLWEYLLAGLFAGVVIGFGWVCVLEWKMRARSAPVFPKVVKTLAFKAMWVCAVFMAFFDILYFFWFRSSPDSYHRFVMQLVLMIWVIGPPLYFALESWVLYDGPYQGDRYEIHKMGQDAAAKLWAAIVVILVGLYKEW